MTFFYTGDLLGRFHQDSIYGATIGLNFDEIKWNKASMFIGSMNAC